MRVIKIKRTILKDRQAKAPTNRRPFREIGAKFFASENHWEFAIEALLFALLLVLSTWPIFAAASAINELL
jgi:hypothetical protein